MKYTKILLITILLILTKTDVLFSQNTSAAFNECIVSIQSTENELVRFNHAMKYFSKENSTSNQLQTTFQYLNSDHKKYELGVVAYPNINDKEDFFIVYDAFSKFSWAIKLYHTTQGKSNTLVDENCKVDNTKFANIKKSIEGQTFSKDKMKMAQNFVKHNCFTIEQMMDIVKMFNMDSEKLTLIKYMYNFSSEKNRFFEFRSILTFSSTKGELDQYLSTIN